MMDRACMPSALSRAAKIFSVRASLSLSLGALGASLAACAGEPPPAGLATDASGADALAPMGAAAHVNTCGGAPAISPPQEVDDPVVGPVYDRQGDTQVACEGDQCLVVWTDARAARARVYATRVSTAGGVLEPFGTLVGEGYSARVAAGDGGFLVAFESTNGLNGGFSQRQIRAARVAADGSVLDPGGFAITALGVHAEASGPQVAYAGGGFVVLWRGLHYNPATYTWAGGVRGAHVGLDGSVIDPDGVAPEGVLLVPNATPRAVAPSSAGAYVLWNPYNPSQTDQTIRGSRLGPDLALLDPGGLLIAAPVNEQQYISEPALGFDGSQNVVAWSTYPEKQAVVARILPDGTLRDASPLPLTGMELVGVSGIAFAGSTAIVTGISQNGGDDWIAPPKVALARLDGDGAQLDPEGQWLSNPAHSAAVATAGGKVLTAWTYLDCVDSDCWGGRSTLQLGWIDPQTGQLEAPPVPVVLGSNEQEAPVVVSQGSGALVFWVDSRPGPAGEPGGIYATRVNEAGEALDPAGILVGAGEAYRPRAVFDGQNTFVLWQRNIDLDPGPGAAWVDQDGAVLDTGPIDLWMFVDPPLVAPHPQGGALLLADYGAGYGEVFRVAPSGAVLDPDPLVGLEGSYNQRLKAISFDGTKYLVVLHEDQYWGYSSQLRGALMSPTGEILAPGVFPIAVDRPRMSAFDVAFINGKHVLLWQEQRGNFATDVRVAQVGVDGQVLTPDGVEVATYGGCPLCVDEQFPASVAVSRGKHGALLAWKAPGAMVGTQEIHGAELGPSGALGASFTLAGEAGIQGQLDLGRLGGGGGKALLTYGRFVDGAPYMAERTQARVIGGSCGGGQP